MPPEPENNATGWQTASAPGMETTLLPVISLLASAAIPLNTALPNT